MGQLVDRTQPAPHILRAGAAGKADDRGVDARPDAPDMEVGDPGIPLGLDFLANLGFQMRIGAVEKDGGGVAKEIPRPNSDDDAADDAHQWMIEELAHHGYKVSAGTLQPQYV